MLTTLIPTVFYDDLEVGLDLFAGGIGMQVLHRDSELAVLARDGIKVHLASAPPQPRDDRPELAIETDSIDADFADIVSRRPDLLHPNLAKVADQPWGAREFALLDSTNVCVIFRSWMPAV